MKPKTIKFFGVFSSLLILAIGVYGIYHASNRGGLPFSWEPVKNRVIITRIPPDSAETAFSFKKNDIILSLDNWNVIEDIDIYFVLDSKKAGESVNCIIQRGNQQFTSCVILNHHYTLLSVILHFCFSIFLWIIGLFVLIKSGILKSARIFWGVCMTVSLSAIFIWNGYPYNLNFFEFIHPVLNFIVYPLVPSFVLWFTLIYPVEKKLFKKKYFNTIYIFIPSFIFTILLEKYYLDYILTNSFNAYQNYSIFYNIFRFFIICYLLAAMVILIHSLLVSDSKENRKRVLWILGSFIFGNIPFLFLWTLPLICGLNPPFIEEINYIFLLIIPISCAISIVRYQLFDIEVIVNRGIVYSIITGIIIISYLIIVVGISHILYTQSPQTSNLLAIAFTVVVAILFAPLKNRVQVFVDKTFYRVKYSYQLTMQDFSKNLTLAKNSNKLPSLLLEHINLAIPCDRIALIIKSNGKYILQGSQGITSNNQKCLVFSQSDDIVQQLKKNNKTLIREGRGDYIDAALLPSHSCLELLDIELIVPIFVQNKLKAFMLFGKKSAGTRFTYQDLELIIPMAEEGILTMDRLNIQAVMLLEKSAKERLAELNRLKSEFVSHVSHELKNPLTSISLSVNNLLNGIPEKPKPGVENYLKMIQECSSYLEHMITNLLDITKIEADKIDINTEKIKLKKYYQSIHKIILPHAQEKGIQFQEDISENLTVFADRNWLRAIFINLIDNAIKYTHENDIIHIKADFLSRNLKKEDSPSFIEISIIDHGIGIPVYKQKIIFNQFERIKSKSQKRIHGLGLGLYIVHKLIALHGGNIKVESYPDEGSKFTFTLPSG